MKISSGVCEGDVSHLAYFSPIGLGLLWCWSAEMIGAMMWDGCEINTNGERDPSELA